MKLDKSKYKPLGFMSLRTGIRSSWFGRGNSGETWQVCISGSEYVTFELSFCKRKPLA